jgi:hypothetical protein
VLQRLPNCTHLAITAKNYYIHPSAWNPQPHHRRWESDDSSDDEADFLYERQDGDADRLAIEQTIELVLSLIASAQMPLRHFTMWLCTRYQEQDVSRDIQWPLINTAILQTVEFRAACGGLQSFSFGRFMDESRIRSLHIVIPLLKAATNLRGLKLLLDEGPRSLAFLEGIESADLRCPLETIIVESSPLGSGEALRNFLAQHQGTLKQLWLRAICLNQGAWVELL